VVDPVPNYLALIGGLTQATRARARAAAQSLVTQAGLDGVAADAGELISKLTEEITAASRANRELLENLVTTEVDKAATRLGFARAQELAALRTEVDLLGARVAVLESRVPAKKAAASKSTAPKAAAAKKTAAKRAAAKQSAAAETPS
jgi:polyhydroxyalkanoate synthesis regulator phasin